MTERTPPINEKTDLLKEGIHEPVIFAAPCYERKDTLRGASFGMMLITPERLIITPLPPAHLSPDMTDPGGDMPAVKQAKPLGPARTRDSSRLESLESFASAYLNRSADEILHDEKNVHIMHFKDIEGIVITRVQTDSRSSRWLSILFALYPLEPAGARYSVDYQLTIMTEGHQYTLTTPFSLPLKQVLVDRLGKRIFEHIDDYAPLL
jgi:hypothetical protein